MASKYELWADYPYGTEAVMVQISPDPDSLATLAETLLEQGHINHWYIVEKRTTVTLHIHAVMGD